MLRLIGERLLRFEAGDAADSEDIAANWIVGESMSWVATAIVLGTTFAAMVLFALSRA